MVIGAAFETFTAIYAPFGLPLTWLAVLILAARNVYKDGLGQALYKSVVACPWVNLGYLGLHLVASKTECCITLVEAFGGAIFTTLIFAALSVVGWVVGLIANYFVPSKRIRE